MLLCHHPYDMKHSQPCSQGFLDFNKLEIEEVFVVFNKAVLCVKLFDTEEAGRKPARNGSLGPQQPDGAVQRLMMLLEAS